MAKSNEPTDAQLLSRLRRRRTPATAAELGTTSARLSHLEGVARVGTRPKRVKGKVVAGRPAVLFTLAERVDAGLDDNPEAEGATTDPAAIGRTGDLS